MRLASARQRPIASPSAVVARGDLLVPVGRIPVQQHPSHRRMLVGPGHCGLGLPTPFHERSAPLPASLGLAPAPTKRGPGARHEQGAPSPRTPCTAPTAAGLPTRGRLPWPQAQPRRNLAPILASAHLTHRGAQGRGRQGPNAGDRLQAWADWRGRRARLHLGLIRRQPLGQDAKLLLALPNEGQAQRGPGGPLCIQHGQEGVPALSPPLREHHTLCHPSPVYGVNSSGAGLDPPLARPRQGLALWLRHLLEGAKAPRRPRYGCTERFGIPRSILIE
jgi:hypothetical protein